MPHIWLILFFQEAEHISSVMMLPDSHGRKEVEEEEVVEEQEEEVLEELEEEGEEVGEELLWLVVISWQ